MLVILLALSACGLASFARISVNDRLTSERIAFIQIGHTTFHDVIAQLGTPDEISGSDESLVATYHFLDFKYSRFNFGWILRFWSPVSPDLVSEGLGLGLDGFEVVFDSSWHVLQSGFTHHHDRPPGFRFYPFY